MFRGYSRLKLPPDKNVILNYFRELKRHFCQTSLNEDQKIMKKCGKFDLKASICDDVITDAGDESIDMLKRVKKVKELHLFDETIAKNFSSMIIDDLRNENGFIAEINPGRGLMTRELLEAGVPKIHGFERISGFWKYLSPLMEEFPGRLEIRHHNLLRLGKIDYIAERTNNDNLDRIFKGLEPRKFEDSPAIIFIGAVPELKFLSALQWSIIAHYLADYGRAVLYAAILPSISTAFSDDPETKYFHKSMIIFLRTFFKYKKYGTVSRNGFYPWEHEKCWRKRNSQYFINDKLFMDIVKLEVNKNYINENFDRHDAHVFFFFLSIHLRKRNTRIIPALEKWIPGCGPRLIRENYNIYTVFDELNSQQLLELFKIFKSWPEYETSSFMNFVDTVMHNERTVS